VVCLDEFKPNPEAICDPVLNSASATAPPVLLRMPQCGARFSFIASRRSS
jgi:hypothetical protein